MVAVSLLSLFYKIFFSELILTVF